MENKNLPKHWQIKKLGEICEYSKGKKPAKLMLSKSEEFHIPYINIKAFEKGVYEEYTNGIKCNLCEDGDILMVWDGARCGLIGKAKKGAVGSTLMKISPKTELYKEYLFYFLRSKYHLLNTNPKGIGIPHIEPALLWNFDTLYPSFNEQQAIVSKIEELFSELDNGVKNLKIAQQQLKVYRQSLLKWAFEGNFKVDYLRNVACVQRGKSKHRPRNDKKLFGGIYPFIQTGDVKAANGKTITRYSQTYSEFGLNQSRLWEKGTLCLTIAANIADTAFLGFDSCFPDSIVGLKPNNKIISSQFINFFIQKVKQEIELKASATAQKNINVEFLNKMLIPVPTLADQEKIIAILENRFTLCDKMEETITQGLQQAEMLRQSILKQAFEGKLVLSQEEKQVYKPKHIYFYQIQILQLILIASKEKHIIHGKMTLAKYAYLLDKIYNIPTYYNYKRWHLGPFPAEMEKAINNKSYFIHSHNNELEVVNETKTLQYKNPNAMQIKKAVFELSEVFSKYTHVERAHKTELLATVCKVIEDIKSTNLHKIRESMKEWPIELPRQKFKNKYEKFTEIETKKCIEFIIKKEWDNKLIK